MGSLRAALATAMFVSLVVLPQARGELVYEQDNDEQQDQVTVQSHGREDERENTRGALRSSEVFQSNRQGGNRRTQAAQDQGVTLPANLPQGGNTSIIQVQPQVQAAAAAQTDVDTEVSSASKSELLRRQRVRTELKNEDMLQERLEELRLRDERRRTDDLLSVGALSNKENNAPVAAAAPEQVVVGNAANQPGTVAPAPVAYNGSAVSAKDLSTSVESDADKTYISIVPRAGVAGMTNSPSNFDVKPHYALGVGLDVGTSENLTFELGYTFAEYGISIAPSNPFYVYSQKNGENLAMKQNVLDLGLKLYLLGRDAKFRPFVGGGGAYAKSYVNYDDQVLNAMSPQVLDQWGRDYELSQFLGYLTAGFDVKVAKNVSIGAAFKYYAVLSSSESNKLNPYAFQQAGYYGSYNPSFGGVAATDPALADKNTAAGSLAKAGFYTVQAGVNFAF